MGAAPGVLRTPGRPFNSRGNLMSTYNILILGASYGSLLATKMLFGGHKISLVCLPAEAELINKEGAKVRLPIRPPEEKVKVLQVTLPTNFKVARFDDDNATAMLR